MGAFTSIITALQGAGVAHASIPALVQQIAGLSPNAAINAACQVILANSNNPAVVKDQAVKLAEVANLPASVAGLIPMLTAAETPLQVIQAVQAIEAAISSQAGFLGL